MSGGFVQVFIGTLRAVERKLRDKDKAVLLSLLARIERRDTVIRDAAGAPHTLTSLARELRKSRQSLAETLKRLEELNLIASSKGADGREKHWALSPQVGHRYARRGSHTETEEIP